MKFSVKIAGIFAVVAFALTAVSANAAFMRDLTLGSTGADVTELQNVLISNGYSIPAGATGYFGAQTQSALMKWQAAVGISPAAGYFGPITRAKLAGTPSTPGGNDNGSSNGGSDDLSGGEASLENFDFSSEDDAEEGESMHIGTIEFDVEDGDIEINRADLEFIFAGSGTADTEPWDVFETITLMIDGDEIAEEDISDEDEWLRDDTPFVFRVSDLGLTLKDGETAEIEVYLTAMNNVDDATNADWTIAVDDNGIRGTDGEGLTQEIGDDATAYQVAFGVDEEGGDEDITIKSSSSDIDATTLLVDTNDDSEFHEVFAFKLEAEESDIDVETLVLAAYLNNSSTSTLNKVISDMYVEIDGESFDDYTISTSTATSSNITFDIDSDYTIDADSTVDVVVFVEFNQQTTTTFNDGATFRVETVSVAGEGADDVSDTATVSGEAHTLSAAVASVTNVTWETSESANGQTGNIDLFFTVTAEEDDFDVLGADILDSVSGSASTTLGSATTTSGVAQVARVSGDSVTTITNGFRVNEGDTTRFRVRYSKSSAGSLEVTVTSVAGQELADDEQLSPTLILE